MNYITLNNGVKMPQLGYGVYQVSQEECQRCVLDALQVGYRSIDTAQSYFNEEQVGTAIEKSGVDRIFLHQPANALRAKKLIGTFHGIHLYLSILRQKNNGQPSCNRFYA